jgi:proteasome lid subunit RPN8/RPN11
VNGLEAMIETQTEGTLSAWQTPECPFVVEWAPQVLDDIRLGVVDAFFSLPRGGAEIGGVLLGAHAGDRVTISDYQALDCEHAYGPSFTLSPNDHRRLAELIAAAEGRGLEVVGWYHSHTRTEVFLSDADLDIHERYFRSPWQVALVLKPSTFHPIRCGFFFREPDGNVRGSASYREFALESIPAIPAPRQPDWTPEAGRPSSHQQFVAVDPVLAGFARRAGAVGQPITARVVEPMPAAPPQPRPVLAAEPAPAMEDFADEPSAESAPPEPAAAVVEEGQPRYVAAPSLGASGTEEPAAKESAVSVVEDGQPAYVATDLVAARTEEPVAKESADSVVEDGQPTYVAATDLVAAGTEEPLAKESADSVVEDGQPAYVAATDLVEEPVAPEQNAEAAAEEFATVAATQESCPAVGIFEPTAAEPAPAGGDAADSWRGPEQTATVHTDLECEGVTEAIPVESAPEIPTQVEPGYDAGSENGSLPVSTESLPPVEAVEPSVVAGAGSLTAVESTAVATVEARSAITAQAPGTSDQAAADAGPTEYPDVAEPALAITVAAEPAGEQPATLSVQTVDTLPVNPTHAEILESAREEPARAPMQTVVPTREPEPAPVVAEAVAPVRIEPAAAPGETASTVSDPLRPGTPAAEVAKQKETARVDEPPAVARSEPKTTEEPVAMAQFDDRISGSGATVPDAEKSGANELPIDVPAGSDEPMVSTASSEPGASDVVEGRPRSRSFGWAYWLIAACTTVALAYSTRDKWMGPQPHSPTAEVASEGTRPPTAAKAVAAAQPPIVKTPPPQEAPIPGSPSPAAPVEVPPAAASGPPATAESTPATPVAPAPAPAAKRTASIAIGATENLGQLQVRWDRNGAAVQRAKKAVIDINDGGTTSATTLSQDRLRSGIFNYARKSERVDIQLTIEDGEGGWIQGFTRFAGKPPERKASGDVKKQRDDLAREAAKLKADLNAQNERNRKLELALEKLKREQQRRRLDNQSAESPR